MNDPDNEHDEGELIDTICIGCDLTLPVNDLGLCDECFAKLERDLIRAQDWDYSATAFMIAPDQLETLRERVIRDYGAGYELIADPTAIAKPKRKNKRSHSRETKRKREIAARAIRDYSTEDVLQAARDFLREQNEEWANASRVMQHLYEIFYKLKPKHLGQPDKKYKSLLKFLEDHPSDFEVCADTDKRGLYWIRLAQKQRD
ncbi:MAG: OST-HTH/LOTUS domain-containing protein [Anaerolineae bacterium]|nr:OST-HTH/LOTUS domain-containing protein [Anaerolineae bacterium]